MWPVISDISIVIVLQCQKPCPNKTINLITKCCVCSDYSTNRLLPHLSPFLGSPYSLRHNNIEIRTINNPTTASKCSNERKSHTSLILTRKLEMIKLSEEGMSRAEIGGKLGLQCQTVSQAMNAKEKFLKEIKSATPVNIGMIRKWNSLIADSKRVLVVWVKDLTSHNILLRQSLVQSKALSLQSHKGWERWGSCPRKVWS